MYSSTMPNSTKKILYLTGGESGVLTGGQKYSEKVLKYFRNSGWSITNINLSVQAKLPLIVRHLFSNINCLFRVLPHLKRKDQILIIGSTYYHSNILLLGLVLKLLGKSELIGLCYHLTSHDARSSLMKKIDRFISYLSMRLYTAFIAISQSTKKDLLDLGVKGDKITVVQCAYDIPHHEPVKYDYDEKRILFVGTCYGRKGIEYLLKAASKLKEYKFHIDIVGNLNDDEKYVESLYEIVCERQLSEKVTFYGRLQDGELREIYKKASIYVLPSLWEGFGIVLLEAMSFGLPIIATNIGAIPELITDNVNGLLVPPKDEDSLARSIELLLNSDSLREKLGRNGLNYLSVHKEFNDWDLVSKRAGEAIEKMVAKK